MGGLLKMKKLLSILVLFTLFVLTACGNEESQGDSGEEKKISSLVLG